MPWGLIESLAARPDVVQIDSSHDPFLEPMLRTNAPYVGADRIHGLVTWTREGFTGKGVLIGLPDTGVDWAHPWLRYENGTEKVLRVLTSRGVYIRGVNLTGAPRDEMGHGTPIAGILVAGRPGVDEYVGVAPHAALLVVDIFHKEYRVSPDLALSWLGAKGARVISISWGWPLFRFFDGSGNVDAIIDELSARGIVVAGAAGNEADKHRHARMVVPGKSAVTLTAQAMDNRIYRPDFTPSHILAFTILWREPAINLTFSIKPPGLPPVPLTGRDNTTIVGDMEYYSWRSTSRRGTTRFDIAAHHLAPHDTTPPPGEQLPNGEWLITIRNPSNRDVEFHAYMRGYDWEGITTPSMFTKNVDPHYTLHAEPVADSMIVVGAYAYSPPTHMGDITTFSSLGPRVDGFKKPDITAPGFRIVTAASGAYVHDPRFVDPRIDDIRRSFSGTSASAPFVAGVAALLLEANPTLTAEQVKSAILHRARVDAFVTKAGEPWNLVWGYGKVDAFNTFKELYHVVSLSASGVIPPQRVNTYINRTLTIPIDPPKARDFAFKFGEAIHISVDQVLPLAPNARYVSAGHILNLNPPSEGTSTTIKNSANLTWRWQRQWSTAYSYAIAPGGEPMRGFVHLRYRSTTPGHVKATPFTVTLTTSPERIWIDDKSTWSVDLLSSGSNERERWATSEETGVATASTNVTILYYHQLSTSHFYQVAPGGDRLRGDIFLNYVLFGKPAQLQLTERAQTVWVDRGSMWSIDMLASGSTKDERWINSFGANQTGPAGVGATPSLYYHQLRFIARSLYGHPKVSGTSFGKNMTDVEWYDKGGIVKCSIESMVDFGNGTRRVFVRWSGTHITDVREISVVLKQPHRLMAEWKTQHFLNVLSEYGEPRGSGWYDEKSIAEVSIEEIVVIKNGTRAVFLRWMEAEKALPKPSVEIVVNRPKTMVAFWKLQHQLTFEFFDAKGIVKIKPSFIELDFSQTDKVSIVATIRLTEYAAIWMDSGQYVLRGVEWMGVDVKPQPKKIFTLDKPSIVRINLEIYDMEIRIRDPLGLPITDAHAKITLANQTSTQLKSGGDGVIRLSLIPLGTFKAEVSYLGQSATLEGDASKEQVIYLMFPLSITVLGVALTTLAIIIVTVLVRLRQRKQG
ncbi:MAG: Subtilase family protein [Candidatus Bathyarchaeota archaeon BA1]|nr:MAG: Subtilase family protein [Candidatus Bathyarchaeota archaeon BA1]